jgi:hypothetical protein
MMKSVGGGGLIDPKIRELLPLRVCRREAYDCRRN